MTNKKPEQTGDNPNKAGTGGNKGDLRAGDIHWITPPPNLRVDEATGTLKPKGPGGPATRKLTGPQRRDLAQRLRAKLGLAANKRAK